MKMLAGFLRPSDGQAEIMGHDVVRDRAAAQRCIGYLPEGAPAWPEMTPRGFLDFIARTRGFTGSALDIAIDGAAERARLAGVMNQPIETLSKGYRRRVGLAQALLHDPDVLILDEPTDGLDPNQKHEVRRLIGEIAGEKAIIVSTHILEEVEAVCTRAAIIAGGKLLADGTPAELEARDPRHGAIRLSFAAAVGGDVERRVSGLASVASVERENEWTLIVLPEGDLSPERLRSELAASGIDPTSLERVRGRLDTVFRMITTDLPSDDVEAAA